MGDAHDTAAAGYGGFGSSLRDLPRLRNSRRGRISSWDETGGNRDYRVVEPGETLVLAAIDGAGSIDHLWFALEPANDAPPAADEHEPAMLRELVLAISWDWEPEPSVLVPIGDFFGAVAPRPHQFTSAPVQVGPDGARSLSCWWHMPFANGARVELRNEMGSPARVYYYVDFARLDTLEDGLGRFHACFSRENPTRGDTGEPASNVEFLEEGTNLTGAGNYVVLDAAGRGHYVGCIVTWQNLRDTLAWNWYGEGDDMIFVDGAQWPPTLHGTGTEDYFGTAFCPNEAYNAPYHGVISPGGPNWSGATTFYRFHVEDPVPFERDVRVTIEHGHANRRSDDVSSVAFWYQAEPHAPFPLLPVADRIPRGSR